jgi:hypothetical protein
MNLIAKSFMVDLAVRAGEGNALTGKDNALNSINQQSGLLQEVLSGDGNAGLSTSFLNVFENVENSVANAMSNHDISHGILNNQLAVFNPALLDSSLSISDYNNTQAAQPGGLLNKSNSFVYSDGNGGGATVEESFQILPNKPLYQEINNVDSGLHDGNIQQNTGSVKALVNEQDLVNNSEFSKEQNIPTSFENQNLGIFSDKKTKVSLFLNESVEFEGDENIQKINASQELKSDAIVSAEQINFVDKSALSPELSGSLVQYAKVEFVEVEESQVEDSIALEEVPQSAEKYVGLFNQVQFNEVEKEVMNFASLNIAHYESAENNIEQSDYRKATLFNIKNEVVNSKKHNAYPMYLENRQIDGVVSEFNEDVVLTGKLDSVNHLDERKGVEFNQEKDVFQINNLKPNDLYAEKANIYKIYNESVVKSQELKDTHKSLELDRQISVSIISLKNQNVKELNVRLYPEELGRVDIKMETDSKGFTNIHILSDKFTTFDILNRSANQIQNILSESGFNSDNSSLNFGMNKQHSGEQRNQNFNNQFIEADYHISPEIERKDMIFNVPNNLTGVNIFI